jgi:hypothetical protein
MSLKELKDRRPFTGFVAYYNDGKIIKERENFDSKVLSKKCATNWAEIDREKLIKLELVWENQPKGFITRAPTENSFNTSYTLNPQDWFFSQKGYYDLGDRHVVVVARNIGYVTDGIINILSVVEKSGVVHMYRRTVAQ